MPETTPLIKAALNLRGGAGFDVYIYSIANYDAMKRLKDVLAEAIYDTFNIPVHYTTLSENEYEEMYALRQEKQCVLFEYYHK